MRRPGFSTYRMLAGHQIRGAYRALSVRNNASIRIILAVMALYFAYALTLAGWRFGQVSFFFLGIAQPIRLANDYLLAAAFSLFGLRFLFGKTPTFRATPYLHLPIRREQLVRYFQGASLVSLHNVFPLLFLVPFWYREVVPFNHSTTGSVFWLLGVLCILAASTWLNGWLRALLSFKARNFAVIVVLAWGVVTADQLAGTFYINDLSSLAFASLLGGNRWTMAAFIVGAAAACAISSRRLTSSLRNIGTPDGPSSRVYREITLLQDLGPVGQLLSLELKMIWRNRRPRHNLLLSVIFSTAYVVVLLLTPGLGDNRLIHSLVGLFASGGFALNYGQLMFAWESSYFDGLMSRDIPAQTIVRAKFVLLQLSCAAFFFLSLPIFVVLRPELVPLHIAFAIYNAGVTSFLIMILAIYNRRRVELWRSGSFFNYEGFSLLHWLWILPISVPPVALIVALPRVQTHVATLISLVGLFGLLLTPAFVNGLSERFARNRYSMLAGFRTA